MKTIADSSTFTDSSESVKFNMIHLFEIYFKITCVGHKSQSLDPVLEGEKKLKPLDIIHNFIKTNSFGGVSQVGRTSVGKMVKHIMANFNNEYSFVYEFYHNKFNLYLRTLIKYL